VAVSVSLVLVFAVAVWLLYRYSGLKVWHVLVSIAFGFYLATSSFAPVIRNVVTCIVNSFSHHG
jgi:hypothetical protein